MGKTLDITGERYHRWVAVKRTKSKGPISYWLCKCDCGNYRKLPLYNLRTGASKSCGCYKAEVTAKRNHVHGLTEDPLYSTWKGIKGRCYYKKAHNYPRYGGKGVKMASHWKNSFKKFYSYVHKYLGKKPSPKHSIDRINPFEDYTPGNLRWATDKMQRANTRKRYINLGE